MMREYPTIGNPVKKEVIQISRKASQTLITQRVKKITLYDNDIDNDKKRKYIKEKFEAFRKSYPGTKKGLDVEFNNFVKKHKDYAEVIDLLPLAISKEIEWHNEKKNSGNWVPEYPHLTTWINQRRWESEFENINENEDKQQNGSRQVYIVPD